jgi:flagellar hook-associated protein 3 FlgL
MRISNKLMADNIVNRLGKQTEQLFKIEERITTGKKINRASDDPIGIGQVLAYRKSLSSLDQYSNNITNAKVQINTVEQILDSVTTFLTQAKKIASDPNVEMRATFAQQVGTIREQVLQMANSQLNGNYIFGGNITDTPPFDNSGTYGGDTASKDYIIGDNLQIGVEADGSRVFQGASDLFAVLSNLQTALQTGNAAVIEAQIQPLDDAMAQIKTVRVENAGVSNRLDTTTNYYSKLKVTIQDLMSRVEDADLAQNIIDLKVQEIAYESTLATSAKIINPSLIDFLK